MEIIRFIDSNYQLKDLYNLYNKVVKKDHIYEEIDYEFFLNNTIHHPEYDEKGIYLSIIDNKLIGFIMAHIRHIEEGNEYPGYISTIVVDQDYRREGIGTKLIDSACSYLKSRGKTKVVFGYISTLNWPWIIPNTSADHNGAPGIMINSDFYLFLMHHSFHIIDEEDAFYLPLDSFKRKDKVTNDLNNLAKENIYIELYDSTNHYGLEEFFTAINSEPFERVIRYNLSLDNPKPFAVAVKDNRIVGWTGAFYTEKSGRAHFDGIIISPEVRGKGLGRALFSYLAEYSKEHGSKFLTFFTGRTNFARNIYMFLGFKIVRSFALMEKDI